MKSLELGQDPWAEAEVAWVSYVEQTDLMEVALTNCAEMVYQPSFAGELVFSWLEWVY